MHTLLHANFFTPTCPWTSSRHACAQPTSEAQDPKPLQTTAEEGEEEEEDEYGGGLSLEIASNGKDGDAHGDTSSMASAEADEATTPVESPARAASPVDGVAVELARTPRAQSKKVIFVLVPSLHVSLGMLTQRD